MPVTAYVSNVAELCVADYDKVVASTKKALIVPMSAWIGVSPDVGLLIKIRRRGETDGDSMDALITDVAAGGYNYVLSIKIVAMTIAAKKAARNAVD